ncbi:MAG: hypothetical protein IPL39_13225 [Opitutaceae bacterium]|nr:hypothetical protein [Opitutaceae bacterium]
MPPPVTNPEPVVISLVLRLHEEDALPTATLAALRAHPSLEIGTVCDSWVPLVAETPDPRELHRWLESLPGVASVDVAFVEVVPQPDAPRYATERAPSHSSLIPSPSSRPR